MPAVQKVVPRKGREFWHALDPDDSKQVVEAVMSEVRYKTAQIHHKDLTNTAVRQVRPKSGSLFCGTIAQPSPDSL
ncbi:hypothetical protein DL95DRAFT_398646, partial [Leptodontidium sp. 2 PMI_412]